MPGDSPWAWTEEDPFRSTVTPRVSIAEANATESSEARSLLDGAQRISQPTSGKVLVNRVSDK